MTLSQHRSRFQGAIALVVALSLLLGSFCPRDWFVCLHGDGAVALVDGAHADGHEACPAAVDCCLAEDACVDLPLSLTLDFQQHAPVLAVLPARLVVDTLPAPRGLPSLANASAGRTRCEPPPSHFTRCIRLLV